MNQVRNRVSFWLVEAANELHARPGLSELGVAGSVYLKKNCFYLSACRVCKIGYTTLLTDSLAQR
jgi:hypothetical protein